MPIVRLQIDLDSEVYPELHAALSRLSSADSRTERLRQLAAAGLVWEQVRLQGAAAVAAPRVGEPIAGMTMRADVASASSAAASKPPRPERRAAIAKRPSASANAPKRRATDFVDLAINAEPAPVQPMARLIAEWPRSEDVEQMVRELPVLNDVVADEDEDSPAHAAAADHADDQHDSDHQGGDHDQAPDQDHDASEDDMPEAIHLTALAQKPQARSRLMKMKERGLFRNG